MDLNCQPRWEGTDEQQLVEGYSSDIDLLRQQFFSPSHK